MTVPLSLSIHSTATQGARDVIRATVATLPKSFRIINGKASVVAVDGRTNWGASALESIQAGATAVVVVNPHDIPAEDARALLNIPVPVVLDAPWRHGTAVELIAPYFRDLDSTGSMLEARTTVRTTAQLRAAITSLAFTAQALLGSAVSDLRDVVSAPNNLTTFATARSGLLLRLSAIVGPEPADRAWFRLLGGHQTATVSLAAPDSGATGIATFVDVAYKITLPSVFESSHRSALKYVQKAIEGSVAVTDVADYIAITTRRTSAPHLSLHD